jgi:tRNA pseudouridine55 synthase
MPIIAINKPVRWTSHDIVGRVRRITCEKRVGHAGTLDPLASGVLVVGITRESTRLLDDSMRKEKEYEALIYLGAYSTTDDEEGEKTQVSPLLKPSLENIQQTLPEFIGEIKQAPPQYSAIKVGGKAAYKSARKGKALQLGFRSVSIYEIELLDYQWPKLSLRVRCGSGVYIRSLARDLGKKLSTGGYLAGLVRTRVGEFSLDQALTIDQFALWWQQHKARDIPAL